MIGIREMPIVPGNNVPSAILIDLIDFFLVSVYPHNREPDENTGCIPPCR
jgi:hypothetical protein